MARSQASIQAFARVSKPTSGANAAASKKRKLAVMSSSPEPELGDHEAKKSKLQQKTPPDTPTRACKRALAGLVLNVTGTSLKGTKRKRCAPTPTPTPSVDSPPASPSYSSQDADKSDNSDPETPEEFHDLCRLNSAFLSALSLHYAHNGTSSPVPVRTLTPSVTKLWGRRRVLLDDLRVCLGILQNNTTGSPSASRTFTICNYGDGRICLELSSVKRNARRVMSQPFDEEQFNRLFQSRLEELWTAWAKAQELPVWANFYPKLPVAQVKMSAAAYTNPLMSKGQQRLDHIFKPRQLDEECTSGQKKHKTDQISEPTHATGTHSTSLTSSSTAEEKPKPDINMLTANVRGLSLLERIRAKEIQALNSTTKLTKAELERQAALQRSVEIIAILDMLAVSKGSSRASFPMPALIRNVQTSVRSPMSKEEIERCLTVLEADVAPGYVKVSKFGTMVGVVINRLCKPAADVIQQRTRQ